MASLERERIERSPFPIRRIWVNPVGSDCLSCWGEKEEVPEGTFFIDRQGIRWTIRGEFTKLCCNKVWVASVREVCSDCGALMYQLEVHPDILGQRIDDTRILKVIPSWIDPHKEGALVFAEITQACTDFNINGHTAEAIRLYTYLRMKNWTPV